ncbi:cytochrome P450 [Nonomuraea thailandensis]
MFLLLVAGHETTANMIPLATLTLLRHPDQLAALRENPGRWPMAVDELLRYHSIVDWVAFDRVAAEDQEIGGRLVRKGEGIFVLGASANRDARAFERPDEFDVERGARHHVAFGYGVHQCLGQNLARAELEIALRTLFERLPGLRVTVADEELPAKYDGPIFGLTSMPVAW